MENKLSIIRKNLVAANNAKSLYDTVTNGQLEELVNLFNGEKISLSLATDIFETVFNSSLLSKEYLLYCKLLYENNSLVTDYSASEKLRNGTISFLDNNYSRRALDVFSSYIKLSCESELDFNSVCEAVYSGRTQYAMIPLYNTRDGLITSLYKLIQKYELKIVASAGILMNDGNTETEFFLVSRNLLQSSMSKKVRIMLSVTHSYDNTIANLLSATNSLNIQLLSVSTLPLEYTDERCESLIILDISACRPDAISCFIHSALPEASIVGIYSIVK